MRTTQWIRIAFLCLVTATSVGAGDISDLFKRREGGASAPKSGGGAAPSGGEAPAAKDPGAGGFELNGQGRLELHARNLDVAEALS